MLTEVYYNIARWWGIVGLSKRRRIRSRRLVRVIETKRG
jgi:hypothetical protein